MIGNGFYNLCDAHAKNVIQSRFAKRMVLILNFNPRKIKLKAKELKLDYNKEYLETVLPFNNFYMHVGVVNMQAFIFILSESNESDPAEVLSSIIIKPYS